MKSWRHETIVFTQGCLGTQFCVCKSRIYKPRLSTFSLFFFLYVSHVLTLNTTKGKVTGLNIEANIWGYKHVPVTFLGQ